MVSHMRSSAKRTTTLAKKYRTGVASTSSTATEVAQATRWRSASAAVLDGSGYAASLWTKPDFGCTLFEAVR